MTTAASDVDSRLRCAVCHELYRGRKPKILPCYHTFCVTCLERLVRTPHVENKGVNFQSGTNVSKQAIICPTCRKVIPVPAGGVTCFLSNSYLDDEVGPDTNEPLPPCDFCEEGHTAKDTCKECKSKFCAQCHETHDMICPEREVIPLCSKPLATLQTSNNGYLGIESVREQIEVLEAVLSRLDEEEMEVEHQKQAIESDIKARYDAGISTLTEAHDVCWNSLTAAVQRTRDRLQKERSAVHRAHEKLTNLAQDTSLTSVEDPQSDAHATLLDRTELSCFKERAAKTRQPLFFAYTSCRASVPYILNFFRDYMGHISSPEGLPSANLTHTGSGRKSPIQATRAGDFSCVSEAELSNHETAISKEVLLAAARESSESKVYLSNLTDRVELLTNKVDLLMNKLQMGQIGISPVINNTQWRMPQPFINPGFAPLIANLLAGTSLQNQIHVIFT